MHNIVIYLRDTLGLRLIILSFITFIKIFSYLLSVKYSVITLNFVCKLAALFDTDKNRVFEDRLETKTHRGSYCGLGFNPVS